MKKYSVIFICLFSNLFSQNWITEIIKSHNGAEVQCRLLWNTTIAKPVFFLEGFDIKDDTELDDIQNQLAASGIIKQLLSKGYTIAIVNYNTPYEPIANLGIAVGNVMEAVWELATSTEPFKVIGFSMGGLVGTYAFTINDIIPQGWTHPKNLLITFDTPHKGAYIPESIYQFLKYFDGYTDDATETYATLNAPAAKQMLLMPGRHTERVSWQNAYDILLDYVKMGTGRRYVGLVNGSWDGVDQGQGYGQMIIDYHNDYGWFDCWPSEIWAELTNQYEVPGNNNEVGEFDIDFCSGGGPGEANKNDFNHPNYENGPGGWRDSYKQIRDGILSDIHDGDDYTFDYRTLDLMRHSFIPSFSASALTFNIFSLQSAWDLRGWEYANNVEFEQTNHTHFDKIYHQSTGNQKHVEITPQNVSWLLFEIFNSDISNPPSQGLVFKLNGDVKMLIDKSSNIYLKGVLQTSSIGLSIKKNSSPMVTIDQYDGMSANYTGGITGSNGFVIKNQNTKLRINNSGTLEVNGLLVEETF